MAELNIQEHFKVPEGYFDNLANQVMQSLPDQPFQPMKVSKRRAIPMWTRYAAAACVAGVIMVSAFTAFYSGNELTTQGTTSPVAAVTTTIADSSKKVIDAIAPTPDVSVSDIDNAPVLAKAEKPSVRENVTVKAEAKAETTPERKVKAEQKAKTSSSSHQSYDMNVNTGYDQNDMERATLYMGIDNQDISEMMYEGL